MIEMIYRERNGGEWKRSFVKTKGDIHFTDFCNPISDEKVELVPVTKKLYLLDYLFFNIPKGNSKVTYQMVIDAIPENVLKDVAAIEFFYVFDEGDSWFMSLFDEDKRKSSIFWVSLLTEKDTGYDLPPVKPTAKDIPSNVPIGISDREWNAVLREFHLK